MRAVERDVVMRDSGLRDGLQSIARIPRAKAGQTVETTLFPPTLDGERLRLFRTTSWRPFMSDRRAFTLHAVRLTAAAIAAPAFATKAFAADYTMRLSHQFPPSHQSARNLEQFAADVKAATDGRVDVQIFGSAQLFKPNQNHAAVASGKVEAASVPAFTLGGTIPELNVT